MTKQMKSSHVTFEAYKAAADRVRRGQARMGDNALCDKYEYERRITTVAVGIINSVFDLPIARVMWEGDARNSKER